MIGVMDLVIQLEGETHSLAKIKQSMHQPTNTSLPHYLHTYGAFPMRGMEEMCGPAVRYVLLPLLQVKIEASSHLGSITPVS